MERIAELEAENTRLSAMLDRQGLWIRTANQFAWAHERACPRHNADAPCNCGLDEFLSKPRPYADSWKQRAEAAEASLAEREARVAELEQFLSDANHGLAELENELAAEKQARAQETRRVSKRCAEIAQDEDLRARAIFEGRARREGNLKRADRFTDGWSDGAGSVQGLIQAEFNVQTDPVIDAAISSTGAPPQEKANG